MNIYFSCHSIQDQEMMDAIQKIHKEAINNFKNKLFSQNDMEKLMTNNIEVNLNSRMKSSGGRASFNRITKKVKIEINYRLHKEHNNALKDTYLHELGHVKGVIL